MAKLCSDCDRILYPSDWHKKAIYGEELLLLCERCAGKRDAGPLVAARERMLEELKRHGLSPKKPSE